MSKLVKIVFTKDQTYGKKNQQKEVKKGFAFWLIKEKLALIADQRNLDSIIKQEGEEKIELEKRIEKITELKNDLEKEVFNFSLQKSNDGDEVFGSVTIKEIIQELDHKGYKIEKQQFIKFKPLKKVGENLVSIRLGDGIIAEIKVIIELKK